MDKLLEVILIPLSLNYYRCILLFFSTLLQSALIDHDFSSFL